MDYGMSRLGRVNYRESSRSPFLAAGGGADLPAARSHSEETAREIDQEVRRIIDQAIERVRRILESRRAALESITKRLIVAEVIDGIELRDLVEASTGTPQLVPGTEVERRSPRLETTEPAPGAAADSLHG